MTVSAPFDPRDLARRGTACHKPAGFRYELEAPLGEDTRTDASEEAA